MKMANNSPKNPHTNMQIAHGADELGSIVNLEVDVGFREMKAGGPGMLHELHTV
jgi:riboflavin synthase alpha subunit